MTERQMPHAEMAEEAVLGAILFDNAVLPEVMMLVRAEDFYFARYRLIFEAAVRLGKGIDYVTLTEELRAAGKLAAVGGEFAVAELVDLPLLSCHAPYYAGIVAATAARRRLILAGSAMVKRAFQSDEEEDVEALLAWASGKLMAVRLNQAAGGPAPVREVASAFYDRVEYWAANPLESGDVRGLATGLHSLDALLRGMQAGELVLLAGRPSMGKSALAFDLARRVASAGGRVLVVSLEMSCEQVMGRWASALSGVPTHLVERGLCPEPYEGTATAREYVSREEMPRYLTALAEIAEYRCLEIDDREALSTVQIRAAALSQSARMGGLDLVVVDHTGLIVPPQSARHETAAKREGQKSRELKALSKELGAPVVLVQQLSRGLEARSNKRPQLSDLRDSGEHEENADIVLGLYWDGYYRPEQGKNDDRLEVSCLKHRRGQARRHKKLRYERPLSRFSEV